MGDEVRNSVGGRARVGQLVQVGQVGELNVYGGGEEVVVPWQVPPEVGHFEDREEEQARVFRAAREWAGRDGPLVVALSGLGGVGKTALGFRLARALEERCPDGVLYVDLDDVRRDGGVEVAEVLGELLRGLGVGPEWVAASFAGRSRQYWDRTRGRRLVVVLDNVRYGAEAVPLLPASAGSVAIVAGQGRLYDLEDGAVVEVPLAPLAQEHAVRLLARIVDDSRPDAEPEALAELARICAGLPAALRVAGQWVRRHRRRDMARLVGQLAVELREKGVPGIEAVWDAAYEDLGGEARRLYRLLAVHPGPDVAPPGAAALLGDGREAAEDALEELENAGLLEPGGGEGGQWRARMHALVRGHAARRARAEGAEGEAAQARQRIVRWYRRQAQRADVLAAGERMTFAGPVPAVPGVEDVAFEGKGEALRWLEAERHALYACVRIAYEEELDGDAWGLCEPLWTHMLDHPRPAEAIDAFRAGRDAAQRAEHLPATVRMRCQLARPLWEQGRHEEAERELVAAVRATELLGGAPQERKLRASALEFRGKLCTVRGQWAAAVPDFEESRRIHGEIGNAYGVLLLTYLLGQAHAALGELDHAVAELEAAHAMAGEQGRERMTARSGFELGQVLRRTGRPDEAARLYEAALAGARRRGSTFDEVRVLEALAEVSEATDGETAAACREAARAIREREGGGREEDLSEGRA